MERVKGQLIVPKYFYMALLMKTGSEYKAIALWVEHQKKVDTSAVKDHAITVKELQNLTGIDFFCNLPDDIENRVEGKRSACRFHPRHHSRPVGLRAILHGDRKRPRCGV